MQGILTDEEREQLIQRLANDMNGNPAVINATIGSFHFVRISTHSIPINYAYNVVRYCEMWAWMETPSLIISLLQRYIILPNFQAAITRIETQEPPKFYTNKRPWDAVLLAVGLPFLNRKITRRAIEYFSYDLVPTIHPAGIRVLVVRGPKNSGKTFTYHYIQYIHNCLGRINFSIAWIDIKKHFTSHFGPLELTKAILDQVNPDWENQQVHVPEIGNEQPARWTQVLCSIITEQITYKNIPHVIVMDGFAENSGETYPVPREVTDMLVQLTGIATGADNPHQSQDMLRMVLLGFDQPVRTYMNRSIVDNIQPLTEADLKQYFQDYALVQNLEMNEAQLRQMLDLLNIANIPQDDNRTRDISDKAFVIVSTLIKQ